MPDGLEARVDRLERENRWLRRGTFLALAVVAGVVLMGQTPGPKVSDEVRTRRLTVVDRAGNERAILTSGGMLRRGKNLRDYGPGLSLIDEGGMLRAALELSPGGPRIRFGDRSGQNRAVLGLGPEGAGVEFLDAQGKVLWVEGKTLMTDGIKFVK